MAKIQKTLRNQIDNFKHFSLLLVLIFHLFVYNYVTNLERIDCDCSKNWQRDFVKYYSLLAIVVSASLFITGLSGSGGRLPILFTSLLSFFGLINAFILFFYTKKLMRCDAKCECSGGMVRSAIHYLSAFRVLMTFFVLLTSLFLIIFMKNLV